MKKPLSPVDGLIQPCVRQVADTAEARSRYAASGSSDKMSVFDDFYFTKEEIIKEVLRRRELAGALADLGRRYGEWHFDVLIKRYISSKVSAYLQTTRDHYGIRVYENYKAGGLDRRWLPMRFVTANRLRQILQEARVLERDIHIKGEGYHIALERLEALERAGKKVKMGDILAEVGPIIAHYRLTGETPVKEKTA